MNAERHYDFTILRSLRKTQGYTIADVAENSGISTAVISRIERNQAVPELETLGRMAKVFGMSATDLLGLAESRLAQITGAQQYTSGGFAFQNINFMNVQVFYGSGPAGAKASRPEVHHNDTEICWVITGKVEVVVGEDRYSLKSGEAIQFDAMLKHEYHALEDTKILTLHLHKGKRI